MYTQDHPEPRPIALPDGSELISSETTRGHEIFGIGDPVYVSWDESTTSVFESESV